MPINIKGNKPIPMLIMITLILFLGGSILTAFGISILVNNETVELDQTQLLSFAGVFVSSLIGNLYLVKKQSEKAILRIAISVLVMNGVLLTSAMLFFNGISSRGWGIALAVLLGGIVALMTNLTNRNRIKIKKYRSR